MLEVTGGEEAYLATLGIVVRVPMSADIDLCAGDRARLTFNRRGPALEHLLQLPDGSWGTRYEYYSQKSYYGIEEEI